MNSRIFIIISAILWLTACQQDAAEESDVRQVFLAKRAAVLESFAPCQRDATTALAELVAESLCSTYSVPENYDDPDGRHIELKVMVIPSLSDLTEPDPLFLLAGGPGQAATDLVQVAQVFSRTRTERDIVLVDQRGTGELSPFDCQIDEEESEALQEQDPDFDALMLIQLDVLRECLQSMDASPQYYTTDIAMRDLDAIRDYLGYSQLNLWGASYGSRAALAYLQAYPANTRAVVIDAIAPTAITLPLYNERDASASLQALFDDCAADTQCASAYPELQAHYLELLDKLSTPQPISYMDDSDYSVTEATLSDYEFLNFIRQVLYSREAQRLIPLIIEQAWQENYRPMQALFSQYSEAQINQGMFLSVICNEDFALHNDALLADLADPDYLVTSAMFNTFVLEACAIWPKREVPASYFAPVTEDNPVLIFSGSLDPITPPVWGELVHDSLPNSQHFVVEGFGHGTLFTQCTAGIMSAFIENGSLDELETDCIDNFKRRPFIVTPGGSALPDD